MRLAVSLLVGLTIASSAGANLITNPGNEAPLIAGEIPGWTEVVGSNWKQRSSDPDAMEGAFYFFAGAGADATLRQIIDVSGHASGIDAGEQKFDFAGYIRTFRQNPSDTARILLSFLAADSAALDIFDSGELVNTVAWQLVSHSAFAPTGTRSVQLDLVSHRNNGTNNDGYFDALSLETRRVSVVSEPGTLLLTLPAFLGLGALFGRRRAKAR